MKDYDSKLVILTLTVNPAIDRTITVDRLAFEDRAYILSSNDTPGGRGINSSSVIHAFGGKTIAVIPAGGATGIRFEEFLKDCGYPVVVVRIRNKVRTNLTLTDKHGLTMKLNEPGPTLDKAEVSKLDKAVRAQITNASWLMLCGSLPPGVPDTFYAELIAFAHKKHVKTLLDTDGEALRYGIEAKPTVVKPNQAEAERLLNSALLTRTHYLSATEQMSRMGPEAVVLSLGSRGVVSASGGKMIEVIPPRVDAISPIGSGDALSAAFVNALDSGKDFADALRWGVAAGTASAALPGMQFASLAQAKKLYEHVEVRRVE
jgi:1-phosphofructokinase family hexose kinase